MCGLFQDPFGGANCAVDDASYDCPIPEGINLGRRTSVSAESMTSTQVQPQDVACFPKTESQEARLLSALRMNVLFQQMEPEIGSTLVQAMREKHVPKGGIVIKQGDDGKYCYVTESGTLDVYVQPPGTPADVALAAPSDQLGTKVLTYGPGAAFGELALMYMQPRAASVVATSDCVLWALDRVTFRSVLAHADIQHRLMLGAFMRQVPLLQHLREDERARVSDAIHLVDYRAGEVVLREGDIGTQFFMVVYGLAEVTKADDKEHPVTLLQRGDYFGELALLRRAPRAATVTASERSPDGVLRVAVLEEDAFTRLLGPLSDIMNRHAETHYGATPAGASTTAVPANHTSSPRSTSHDGGAGL